LNKGIDDLSETLKLDRQSYSKLESSIGDIQRQAAIAKVKLDAVQDELNSEDSRLQQVAQDNVAKAHEVSGLRKTIEALSIITKAVPIFQPALGYIGTGLDTLDKIGQSDVLTDVGNIVNAADQFNSDVWKKSSEQADTELKQLDPSQAANAKDYLKSLVPVAKNLSEAQKKLADLNKTVQAPQSEVEAELARLRSGDPQYQKYIKDVVDAQATSTELSRSANDTLQQIDAKFDSALADVDGLGALNDELSMTVLDLDPTTQSYLEEMKRRANDRLLKYHYYFAKAYEYRTLQRYPHNLRQDVNFDRLLKIASTDTDSLDTTTHDFKLSPGEFDRLKTAYEAPLSDAVQNILEAYNNRNPQRSDRFRYPLSDSELKTLNETGAVTIDLQQAGMIRGNEENQRIVSITAADLLTDVAGNENISNATLKVTYEHPPISLIPYQDAVYVFRHPDSFTWGTTRDVINKENSEVQISSGDTSLLSTILNTLQNGDKMQLFSEPSLLGPIIVSRTVIPDVHTPAVTITRLNLKIVYDYNIKRNPGRILTLESPPGMAPYFQIDATDLSGLSSGMGNITRTYASSASVRISAPRRCGKFQFVEWKENGQWIGDRLEGGKLYDKSPDIVVLMNADRTLQALYMIPNQ
jgi:hypothetical protein